MCKQNFRAVLLAIFSKAKKQLYHLALRLSVAVLNDFCIFIAILTHRNLIPCSHHYFPCCLLYRKERQAASHSQVARNQSPILKS